MYDTIIIGAGMSGLAAGIRLACFNQRVCILERHSAIGGMNSFYRQRGRDFDVGLHAITNFAPAGTRRGPLSRLLRQLRLAWEELSLSPQIGSRIAFPGVQMEFSNEFTLLESEVARHFPRQIDGFRRLVGALIDYDQVGQADTRRSAREVVRSCLDDPLLTEMLFCPILFYGGPQEHDLEFGQFSVLFRSIFLEGLARPLLGVRLILKRLLERFLEFGGELRLRAAVERLVIKSGLVERVVLEDGTELKAQHVLSSAGWPETMRLCDGLPLPDQSAGRMSVIESISVLNTAPRALGHDRTLVFFNASERFHYEQPDDLVDFRSGVICSPNNFIYDEPLAEGKMRLTCLANYGRWAALDDQSYRAAKRRCHEQMAASAVRFVPDFRSAVIETDVFTPKTIRRFTGRENGAVYGVAEKRYDGITPLQNLFICGTDQGLVGIIGTIISGISIANKYLLKG